MVEPAAVENGTYVKYDVVDVAGSGHGFMLFDDSNVVFGLFDCVVDWSWMEDINATLLYKHVAKFVPYFLFIMQKY